MISKKKDIFLLMVSVFSTHSQLLPLLWAKNEPNIIVAETCERGICLLHGVQKQKETERGSGQDIPSKEMSPVTYFL
jgi:hypothetical protein